ncbi:MAG TPA: hypothetical protein VN408_21460 [Actinoplanes sp.]|nr:hypothetical protein [Actinoplanes sp.]
MTVDRIAELLAETSADVSPPSLAEVAWTRAASVRRRRRVTVVVTAAVAVVAVTVPFVVTERRVAPAPPAQTVSPVVVAPRVDGVPAVLVPSAVAPLPTSWDIPAGSPVLSANPVGRVVAVAQERLPDEPMLPLHVLDESGRWLRVDVGDLIRTHDEGGNEADPLRTSSLAPDGRRVALPQPNAVVVIDVTTAEAHRIAVPGLIEQVLWLDDDTVLAEGGGEAVGRDLFRIGWRTGTVTPEAARLSLWNAAGTDGAVIPELAATDGRRTLRMWAAGAAKPLRESVFADAGLPERYHVSEWYGGAVPNGAGLIAAAAWGDRPINGPDSGLASGIQMITVIDTTDGSVRRWLDLGAIGQRMKSCCRALDWIGTDVLLIRTDKEGLISWNVRTGEVRLITAGPIPAELSIRME